MSTGIALYSKYHPFKNTRVLKNTAKHSTVAILC